MPARVPIAVHVFLLRGGSILMLRRANTGFFDGSLSVPAGHVEPGETATAAALRELREEVGLELERARLRPVAVMHRCEEGEERVDFFLECRLDGETPRNCEPHKCSELLWASAAALPADTIPYVRAAIANYRSGRWFEEFGWGAENVPEETR